jgi:hypothetical protein
VRAVKTVRAGWKALNSVGKIGACLGLDSVVAAGFALRGS